MMGNVSTRALLAGGFNDVFKGFVLKQTLHRMGVPSGDSAPFTFFTPTADGRKFSLHDQRVAEYPSFEHGFKALDKSLQIQKYGDLFNTSRIQLENYVKLVKRMDRRWKRKEGPALPAPEVDDGPDFLAHDFADAVSLKTPEDSYFPSATDIAEVFLGPQDHMILGTGLRPEATEEYRNYYYPDPSDPHSQRLEPGRRKPQVEIRDELIFPSDVATFIPRTAGGLVYMDTGLKPGHFRLRYHGDLLMETYKRWPSATYIICYDVENRRPMEIFTRVARTGSRRILNAEAYTDPFPLKHPTERRLYGIRGVGCCIINPPEHIQEDLLGTINLLEQFFAATKPRGEPDTDRFVPPVRVNWFGGATEKIVGRAHDRPSWGRLAHRGTEWTEELATAYARHEAYRIANSFAMLDKDIDLHTIPDSAFDPSCNRFAEQNPDLTREELIALMDEEAMEQAVFQDQDEWLRGHFRRHNMT